MFNIQLSDDMRNCRPTVIYSIDHACHILLPKRLGGKFPSSASPHLHTYHVTRAQGPYNEDERGEIHTYTTRSHNIYTKYLQLKIILVNPVSLLDNLKFKSVC